MINITNPITLPSLIIKLLTVLVKFLNFFTGLWCCGSVSPLPLTPVLALMRLRSSSDGEGVSLRHWGTAWPLIHPVCPATERLYHTLQSDCLSSEHRTMWLHSQCSQRQGCRGTHGEKKEQRTMSVWTVPCLSGYRHWAQPWSLGLIVLNMSLYYFTAVRHVMVTIVEVKPLNH